MTTTTPPISVQLYSVREASLENFDRVLELIAKIGFKGVEPFNLFGKSPPSSKAGERFRHGSIVYSLSLGDPQPRHLPSCRYRKNLGLTEYLAALGRTTSKTWMRLTAPSIPPKKSSTRSNLRSHPVPAQSSWEYEPINGRTGYHYLQDAVPEVEFKSTRTGPPILAKTIP